MILISKHLIVRGYSGFAVWPFIIARSDKLKRDRRFINHERIHLKQQLELLVLPFFIWYSAEYFLRLMKYRNARQAYRTISFEKEAYAHESDLYYLDNRKTWNFFKYL